MKKAMAFGGMAAFLVASAGASAQVIEDFDGGFAGYSTFNGTFFNLSASAELPHDGPMGGLFINGSGPPWYYNNNSVMTAPGNTYRSFCRWTDNAARVYMGVAASAGGCWSAVIGPNLQSVIVQQNSAYGFVNFAETPISLSPNVWYVLEMNWDAGGNMTASVYKEDGVTLIGSAGPVATGVVAPGGFAVRGFNLTSGARTYIDTVVGGGGGGGCDCVCNYDTSTGRDECDFFDFINFQDLFAAGDECGCDLDTSTGKGVCDFFDFINFQDLFSVGC